MTVSSGKQTTLRSFFSLLPAAAGVLSAVTHTLLVYSSGDVTLLPLTLIFWLSAGLLIWQKRRRLVLEPSIWSQLIGATLLGAFFMIGLYQGFGLGSGVNPGVGDEVSYFSERFLASAPFLVALGVGLISTSWTHLRQYRAELTLLFFFGVPKAVLWTAVDLREISARFSTAILDLLGQNPLRVGTVIALPTGSVDVVKDCSGLSGMLYLSAIAALLLTMMPLQGIRKYWVPLLGIAIAFLSNGARIAFLAIAAADPDPATFERLHGRTGFSLGALVLFCAIYCLLYWQENRKPRATAMQAES